MVSVGALEQALSRAGGRGTLPDLADDVVFGRALEDRRIDRVLAAAAAGASSTVVVCGEAGIGKTALLGYAARRGRGRMTVLEARGTESESALPFAALGELLGPLLGRLSVLPAPQAAALRSALALAPGGGGSRFAVSTATLGLLAAAAERRPLLALVEDVHWLDRPTLEALVFVARRLESEGIALLMSCREPVPHPVAAVGLEVLRLGGLSAPAVAELLGAVAGRAPAAAVAERLTRETGGNPLALKELGALLTGDQLQGIVPLPDPVPAGASAERLFARRFAALDGDARRAALIAAAAGPGEAGPVLAAAAMLGVGEDAFERLERARLVSVADGALWFVHPLARSVAYAAGSAGERRAAHRVLAGRTGGDRGAWHLAAAAFGVDEHAAAALEQAAEHARERSGFAAAAAALERAARLSPSDAARARRLVAAADSARLAGRADDALRLLEATQQLALEGELEVASLAVRARAELARGRVRAAHQLFTRQAAQLQTSSPARAVEARAQAAMAAVLAGDLAAAVNTVSPAQLLGGRGAGATTGVSELLLGYALLRAGRTAEGVASLERSVEASAAGTIDDATSRALAASVLIYLAQYGRARAILNDVIRDARASSALGELAYPLHVSAYLDTRLGRWAAAYASASEAVALARETGGGLWRCLALSSLATIEAGQGREAACREHAGEARALAASLDIECPRDVGDALGLLELGLGRPKQAITEIEPTIQVPGPAGAGFALRTSLPDLVEAYVRARDPRAAALAHQLAELAANLARPAIQAFAERCVALVAGDDRFDAHFNAALQLHQADQWPFAAARTELCYGERLRRVGRRIEARAHLRAALAGFESLGAEPWAQRAQSELGASGQHIPRHDPTAAERLTPQELQIALTVTGGATNREAAATLFLSPKTIEHHLSVIYRKLGVRSRTELANKVRSATPEQSA